MAKSPRDTHVYHLRQGNRKLYTGISNNVERRVAEHAAAGKQFTAVDIDGPARTRTSAERREAQALATYRRGHGGRNPLYNKTRKG